MDYRFLLPPSCRLEPSPGTEASAAAIDWAFDHLGWTEVIHSIDPDNTPSQQVALRLGSRLLGPGKLPPPYDTTVVELWGQDRDTWRARRKKASSP